MAENATKTLIEPVKRAVTIKSTSAANIKHKTKSTTATATKITRLILKPKPKPVTSKSSLTSKVTSTKYITKPVTIKSRSTMISHASTFRIQNIKKTSPSERQHVKNEFNGQISQQQLILNGNNSKLNQSFEMVHSERNTNITSLNVTQIVNSPILQEITSNIVNESNLLKSSVNELEPNVSENVKNSKKITKHSENDTKIKPKSYDPIKARQFIRMQKEKRKEIEMEKSKIPATKEEIKQRLNALRTNTLKIVEKNVEKVRKNVKISSKNSKSFTSKTIKEQPKSTAQKQKGRIENCL